MPAATAGVSTPGAASTASGEGRPVMPPLPRGKTTILGGAIHTIDPVLDRLTLNIYGEKPMKILFDERTQVFRDGKRIGVRDLAPTEFASIQTTLDGTQVFAVSIHVLSQAPQGDYQGRILTYSPENGDLDIEAGIAAGPLRVTVSPQTSIHREGQAAFSAGQSGTADLSPGALVSVDFEPGKQGRALANRITILATPGSSFVFSGSISTLDLHSGFLVLVDPRDGKYYRIFFNSLNTSSIPALHSGDHIRVDASYDGTHYVANEITAQ